MKTKYLLLFILFGIVKSYSQDSAHRIGFSFDDLFNGKEDTLISIRNKLYRTKKVHKQTNFSIGVVDTVYSKILNEKRIVNIYLPDGYNPKDTAKYPVIFLLDGSADEDFIHISGLVQYLSFPWINETKPSIVVGIANIDRRRDFTYPTKVKQDKMDYPTAGGSESFINFIENELQPYIIGNYRTDFFHTIIGQSLGGLLATEILFKKPAMFNNYVIVSPSLWWDNQSLLKTKFPLDAIKEVRIKVHISVGMEGQIMEKDAKQLYSQLTMLKNKNLKVAFKYHGSMRHETICHWAVYNALGWVYAD